MSRAELATDTTPSQPSNGHDKSRRARRHFSDAEKRDYVKRFLALDGEIKIRARTLGLQVSVIRRWVRAAGKWKAVARTKGPKVVIKKSKLKSGARRKWSYEDKVAATARIASEGRKAVSDDIGISPGMLHSWISQVKKAQKVEKKLAKRESRSVATVEVMAATPHTGYQPSIREAAVLAPMLAQEADRLIASGRLSVRDPLILLISGVVSNLRVQK